MREVHLTHVPQELQRFPWLTVTESLVRTAWTDFSLCPELMLALAAQSQMAFGMRLISMKDQVMSLKSGTSVAQMPGLGGCRHACT